MTFDDDGPLQGAGALPRVQGAGGGGGKSGGGAASSAPDTLFSTATVRLVDLLGEGEIVGVRGGLKGVYLNDVPVQNEDGSFNFKGLTAEFRVGTPDQPYMAGYPDVQTPRNVGIKVNAATPVTVSITDTDVDRLRVTVQVPSLILAKSDGSVRANSVSYRVQARYSGGPWVNSLGDQTITGKTTSGYFRSHEIALPINPSGASAPWQVQVIRLSPDTDDFNNSQAKFTNQSDLVFYSTTSIVDARFSYPHSAMVGLTAQAASFGSSVPGRTYLVDGVLMPIPSNYDPVARTYSGVWDGTFKEGFSNNPAWALNLILRNDRFGLGEFIDTAAIDKWSLYEIGRYCDVPVSDGKGGQEPRYVFNGAISTQQEAFELLQLIAQVFRGTVYWSSGTVTAAQDRPSDPVLLVTEANAIEGENGEVFAYASSGRRARHTVALVAWNDPDNLYKQTIEVVEDSDGVARYGYNPTRIDLLGCTSRGQAHRTGLWTLFTEMHQTQVLTYRAGLDHAVIRPGDIVAVQDPQIANLDLSGRLMGGSTASVLVLDRPVTLASGAAYTVSVVMPDGTVQEREISTGAGTVSSVTLRSALPQVPDPAAVWLIAGPVEPQLFRVVSIREEEPHIYAVAALQHEPGKYATIDDGAAFEPSPITEFPNIVLPPTNLSVRESQYTELGQPKQAMTLSWLPGQAFNSVAYFVTVIRPSGATVTTRTASQSIDFLEAEVGVWTFVVVAIGLNGKSSLPAQTTYTLSGWAGQAATTVASLSIKGGGSTFTGRSCTVAWTNQIAASVPPYPVRNAVYVFDASTQALVHREVLPAGVTEWTYDYFLNVNEGGPRRQFRVGVTAYSAAGDEGPPAYLAVSNPAPDAINPALRATSEVLFADLPRVTDPDFAGYLVWVSETPGINPLTATPHEVAGSLFTFDGTPGKTYYVRAAAFDAFGKNPAELNISAEQSQKITIQIFDTLAPPIPGTPTLVSNVAEVAPDGAVTSKVTITWPGVTSDNLGTYEVAIAEGNNPAEAAYVGGRFVAGTTAAFAGLMPGRQYSFKVRSNPLNGFADSGWSAVLVVTAALNTTPPAAPTGFTANPSFEAADLAWTNPTNKDLLGVEVWAGTTNLLANAVLLKTVPSPAAFYRDVLGTTATKFYWIRSVNTSDFKSGYVGPLSVTSAALAAAQLAAGIIDATKLASSIAANTVVTSLPATKTTDYVTLGGEQYRWDATTGRYTKAVSAADIAGKVAAAQIDTINAAQISDQIQASQVSVIPATQITGQMTSDQIASIAAAKIAGQVTSDQIAAFDASKLYGDLDEARIKTLAAGKITGQLGDAQLAAIDGAKVAGALSASTIQALNDNRSIRGIVAEQIASVNASAVGYGLTSDQIVGLAAAKLAGQIVGTQITDGAITTGKLDAGAVTAGKIEAGAITASKLAIASANVAYNPDLSQGVRGWSVSGNMPGMGGPLLSNDWAPTGFKSVYLHSGTTPAAAVGAFVDLASTPLNPDGTGDYYLINGEQIIEASACLSAHRCTGRVIFQWFDGNKQHIAHSDNANLVTGGQANGGAYKDFPKSRLIAKAPTNARYLKVFFRMDSVSGDEPYLFVSGFMLAAGFAGQTEASPYVAPGSTTIDGGTILTDTIGARQIVANSITTGELNVGQIFADAAVINAIMAQTITTANLTAKLVDAEFVAARNIATDAVTARAIRSDAIEARHIKAGEIETRHMDAGSINASVLVSGSIKAEQIEAGAITASQLSIVSTNLAYNPDLSQGMRGWALLGHIPGLSSLFTDTTWCPSGHKAIAFMSSADVNSAAGTFADIETRPVNTAGDLYYYPVTGGQTYEYSICASNHRCTARLFTQYFDASGAHIGYGGGASLLAPPSGAQPQGGTYAAFPKLKVIEAAPANAVSLRPFVRMQDVSGNSPYLFLSAFMMAATRVGATETSPYVAPGITTIDGSGIITRSLRAQTLVAGSITADELGANSITAQKIRAGAIETAHMTAGSINADRLVAQSITAGLIAGSTITGDKIAGRTISAGNIVANTITGNEIQAASVNADRLIANSITTAQIAAGAIKTAQLDAGAITADKLGVGLNTGNLIWNSDQALDGWFASASNASVGNFVSGNDGTWAVTGLRAAFVHISGTPPAGQYAYLDFQNPNADGGRSVMVPVQGGQIYEVAAYVSAHRCRGNIQIHFNDGANYIASHVGNYVTSSQGNGAPNDTWRSKLKITAPPTAKWALIRGYAEFTGETDPYCFFSGIYVGLVPAGIPVDVYSAYAPSSRTVISGGQIATNSLNARSIVAGTITADQIGVGQITVDRLNAEQLRARIIDTDGITASKIIVGNNRLSNWVSINDTTRIDGGAIAANSIAAGRLNIEARGITPVNVYFEMERDGNGNPTNVLKWTAGQIEYIDNNGNRAFSQIPAGRVARGGDGWATVWFNIALPGNLHASSGNNIPAIRGDANCILVATTADATGVIVNWGGTVIDGDKIVANSIQARNIAANQIQTQHMAANSISGDRIAAGTISADKITTGTLTVNAVFSLGSNSQTDLYAHPNGGIFRVRNRQLNQWRAAFGYVGDWTGDGNDFGLLLWGADGVNRLRFSNAVNFIDGVIISDATIQNAKIANLTIGNEKVQSEAITRGAFATTGAGGADTSVGLTIRNPGTRVVIWVARTGAAGQRYLTGAVTGQLQIYWARPGQGWELIRAIPNAFMYEYVNGQGNYLQHLPTSDMCQVGTLEGGYYQFRVLDTSAAGASSVSICAVEFSK